MRLQLWSYNFAPEPTGIGPISTTLAHSLRETGHQVEVVAAHPHYPEPVWGKRIRPYREIRDGLQVLRLPLWVGRASAAQRLRQEASFATALLGALPFLGRPDALIAVSPSFPALSAAIVTARARRIPWILWLQDILPDGAVTTGQLAEQAASVRVARRLERSAYRSAERIAVISETFRRNLAAKGVAEQKVELIRNPASLWPAQVKRLPHRDGGPRILAMGNIGRSQGLSALIAAFEASPEMERLSAHLAICGTGVEADAARAEIRSQRVEMPGVVSQDRLERELHSADFGLISQRPGGTEFNLPSKLMNFMASGLPVIAVGDPRGELASIVEEAGAGWVVDATDPNGFPQLIASIRDEEELRRRGDAGRIYAERNFSPDAFGKRFEALVAAVARA